MISESMMFMAQLVAILAGFAILGVVAAFLVCDERKRDMLLTLSAGCGISMGVFGMIVCVMVLFAGGAK